MIAPMRRELSGGLVLAVALAVAGCYPLIGRREPSWLSRGSGLVVEDGRRLFVGVGKVEGMRNQSLAALAAKERARGEMARLMAVFAAELSRRAAPLPEPSAGNPDHPPQAARDLTAAILRRARLVEHWEGRSMAGALSVLDLEEVKEEFRGPAAKSLKMTDILLEAAEPAFDAVAAGGQAEL